MGRSGISLFQSCGQVCAWTYFHMKHKKKPTEIFVGRRAGYVEFGCPTSLLVLPSLFGTKQRFLSTRQQEICCLCLTQLFSRSVFVQCSTICKSAIAFFALHETRVGDRLVWYHPSELWNWLLSWNEQSIQATAMVFHQKKTTSTQARVVSDLMSFFRLNLD